MAELNTQFPAWLAQRQWYNRENRAGQEFLQGAQVGAQISARQREVEYRDRALQLERDAFELRRNTQLQNSEGMIALGTTLSEIAATGSWDSPESEVKFWDTVRRYPAVTQSTNFDNLAGIFERAKQAKLQRDLATERANRGFAPSELEKSLNFMLGAGYITPEQAGALGIEKFLGPQETMEMTTDESGRPVVRVIKGRSAVAKDLSAPTTAFQTQLQQQLHSYDKSMSLLDHIEKNMNASDFGLRGMAKELKSRIGGQFGLDVPPEQLDVRNSLKQLRQDLFKALRSDSNITGDEKKSIQAMLPEVEMFDVDESLPNAVGKLMTVKRTLQNASRSAAQKLGVLPPLWTLSTEEIVNAVKSGKLNRDEAKQFLMENR